MRIKFSVQNAFFITTLAFILGFVFFGCGIKNTIALAPARVSEDDTARWVRIEHNTTNQIQSFKGYDIYYKFYKEGNTSSINSDRDYLTDSTRVSSRSTLTTKKFRLVQRFIQNSENSVDIQTPHIKPDSKKLKESHTVYIDFSAGKTPYSPLRDGNNPKIEDNAYLSPNGENYNMLLVRYDNGKIKKIEYVKRDTNPPKSFFESNSSQYSASDSDVKNMIGSSFKREDNNKLLIVFAVIPYGIDFTEAKISYGPIVLTDALELEYQDTP